LTTTINASPSNGIVSTADGSGVLKVQSNGVTTNALAWVNFVGSTGVVTSGYNVSSVTRASTGLYTINFTTANSDANYAVVFGICGGTAAGGTNAAFVGSVIASTQYGAPNNKTTSACQIGTNDYTSTFRDFGQVYVAFFGN
jgi:hypothetical protein